MTDPNRNPAWETVVVGSKPRDLPQPTYRVVHGDVFEIRSGEKRPLTDRELQYILDEYGAMRWGS